jgi:hypothetical protein
MLQRAADAVDSGAASEMLKRWTKLTTDLSASVR